MAKPDAHPEPLVVEAKAEHKMSWIVLHGRGDTAEEFARGSEGFLTTKLPNDMFLQDRLPNTRFIFPQAKLREAYRYREYMTQWFDVYSYESCENSHVQMEGLLETSLWLHELVINETRLVGAKNVVLGGLSQGCASSLIALLLWDGEPFRCVFGMSGWLPLRDTLESSQASRRSSIEIRDQITERPSSRSSDQYNFAVQTLARELQYESSSSKIAQRVPIILTHGDKDDIVDIEAAGRRAYKCLQKMGLSVRWEEYPDLKHWFRGDELADIAAFVESL